MNNANESTFSKNVQEINTDFKGKVQHSSNTVVDIKEGSNIFELHPFFESLKSELQSDGENYFAFPCVQLDISEQEIICDITIKVERDFLAILLFDYSQHYERLHDAAQEKKTAMMNEQAYQLNTQYNEEKKEYIEYIRDRIDRKIITTLEEVVMDIKELNKTTLSKEQQSVINKIKDNVGRLHLKAVQIKEGLEINLE